MVTVVGSMVPSGSESLPRMLIVTGVSSAVVAESSTATGGSWVLSMVRFTVATLETLPSLSSTV